MTADEGNPFLILLTLPKSGTNLLRIALTNYICHLEGDEGQKTYADLREMFPNTLEDYVNGGQQPCHRTQFGFRDFIYQHGEPTYLANKERFPGPVVATVRNPLDYLVSAYHFFFKSRQNSPESPDHPIDIAKSYLPLLVGAYRAFQAMDCLLINYEDLVGDTAATMTRVARHYGLPVDGRLINLAVEHSSLKAAQAYEQQGEPIHVRPGWEQRFVPGFRFVRNGSVGQWRDYFNADQVGEVKAYLKEHQVPFDAFIYEPRAS